MPEKATTADRGIKVFISYSRKDADFARRIVAALETREIAAKIDTRDLPTLEEWRRELLGFIREADAVIFIISSHSVHSPVCDWEVEQVAALNKRLAPIVLERVPDDHIPAAIAKINYLFFDPPNDFETQASALAAALQTDREWVKNHTRFGERACDWEARGYATSLLLRGQELEEAEKWIASHPRDAPEPTQLQRTFVSRSRRAATRQLRLTVAGSLVVGIVAVALAAYAFKKRAETVHVLATSDFQRGSVLLQSDDSTSEGMALLARSARQGGDQRALTRLWTLLQQRGFWLPTDKTNQTPAPPAAAIAAADAVPDAVQRRFNRLSVNGNVAETQFISISGDGKTVFTAVGDGHTNTVLYRVWHVDGKPVTNWLPPEYHGIQLVDGVRGFLSFDGRFLALEVESWRETYVLRLFDLKAGKQIGTDIPASGALPTDQNIGYSLLHFLPAPQSGSGNDEFVWLLAASSKGDVSVFRVDAGDVELLARNRHSDRIVFAAVDSDHDWLMSSSYDGTARVSSISHQGEAVGNVLSFASGATSLTRVGSDGLSATFADSQPLAFGLRPPGTIPVPADLSVDAGEVACRRFDDDATAPPAVEHLRSSLGEVNRPGARQLTVGDQGRKIFTSPPFDAEIVLVCLSGKGDQISITTKDFVTETWAVDFSRRFGLPIVERRLFGAGSTPTTTAMTAASRGGAAVTIESYLWEPPNVAESWYSFWDSESALPLTDRAHFVYDISDDKSVEMARMDSTGRYLVFLHLAQNEKATPLAVLQIAPPASVKPWLADFAEAVAGVSVNDDGAFVPVPDRLSILARGSAELTKLTVTPAEGK